KFFRYEWEGTYKIITPYNSFYDFDYQTNNYFYRTDPVNICYSTDYSNNLIVGNSLNNEFGKIVELPILFIPGESYKIRTRYSMLVKQYSITQGAYTFYKKLKESNETGGFLFDKQLGSIIGNIVNKQDLSEPVLGFFEVSSVSEQRRFFNLRDLDSRIGIPPFKYKCDFNEVINTSNDSISYYLNRDRSLNIINIAFMTTPAMLMNKECTNCSWYATTTKPDFWID
ncbi:MAG: DUF4249 domain-containing protein, partial [Cyclobacteriaceae bacterium]|nr:DUF4249 domain-containing protein [Cyclobacteriaceae bacterium]